MDMSNLGNRLTEVPLYQSRLVIDSRLVVYCPNCMDRGFNFKLQTALVPAGNGRHHLLVPWGSCCVCDYAGLPAIARKQQG